jgi:uncharacterized damage-inducible protein DinB
MCLHSSGPAAQIDNLLQQLAAVVGTLDDSQYRAERARGVSGSVGGHVRHCLDHVAALVSGSATGQVDYDARLRGTAVESWREAALQEIARLRCGLATLHPSSLDAHLDVMLTDTPDGTSVARSTMLRELAFVASHTVHHFAIVSLLLREMGIGVPARFGYAPSTPTPDRIARAS